MVQLGVSDKVASFDKKPHIRKGYYAGKLMEVKQRAKDDGTPIEGKYGKQIIMLFSVFEQDGEGNVGKEVMVKMGENGEKGLVLAQVLNSEYKQDDGTYRTAVTPNSRITKVFQALGWDFDAGKELNTDDFIGKWVELNIDDIETTWKNEKGEEETYKCSVIKDVNKFEGATPSFQDQQAQVSYDSQKPVVVTEELTHEDIAHLNSSERKTVAAIDKKIADVKQMYADGNLTKEGYDQAIEQLENHRKVMIE